MKPCRHFITTVSFIILAFSLTGCVSDPIAWSPDGRYLAFMGMNDQKLYLWDNMEHEARLLVDDEIQGCRFVLSGEYIVYTKQTNSNDVFEFRIRNINSNRDDNLVDKASQFFDTTQDGKLLFFSKGNQANGSHDLWQVDLRSKQVSMLHEFINHEIQCVDADPSGNRFLLTLDEKSIVLWDKHSTGEPRVLHKSNDHLPIFPQWLDSDRYLYFDADDDGDMGTLMLDSIESSKPKVLCENVFYWDIPSVTPDGKSIVVTVKNDADETMLLQIDLATGKPNPLTTPYIGASWAALNPQGDQAAFISNAFQNDETSMIHLLNLENGTDHIIWRDEEERLMATSEALYQSGQNGLAVKSYQDLLHQFPNSRFSDSAWMRIMQLYLVPPYQDIDKAFHALTQMSSPDLKAHAMFWNETDRIATDPKEDWILRYATKESQEKFQFNTDLTRDLCGLSVKCSDKRLFLKVDYNSNRDLSGLTFMDTVILLDYDSPNEGYRKIGKHSEWDRGAERIVQMRHWYRSGVNSQYDIAILNGQGENVTNFLASGFDPPDLPNFDLIEIPGYIDTYFIHKGKEKVENFLSLFGIDTAKSDIKFQPAQPDGEASIVFSISKDVLDLPKDKKFYIQICTLKGGIEGFQHTEKPQQTDLVLEQGFDVTDAFGPENNTKRIESDFKSGMPATIKGYAAVLNMK